MRIILDTNIIVDVLQQRDPWFVDGQKIFIAVANKRITGCITAKQAADIHFFSRKQFKGQENADGKVRRILSDLFLLFELLDTLGIDCQKAITVNNNDYEDAMLIKSAERSMIDGIVTRNPEHFKSSPIAVYSPKQLINILEYPEE